MVDLTVIIPFWNGHKGLPRLLDSIPDIFPVIIINDFESDPPDVARWPNVRVANLNKRGYFSGACNAGMALCQTDVLILNQDGKLSQSFLGALRDRDQYAIIGDGVMGHPGWPAGYVQGTFMFIRRDLIQEIGGFDADLYPLWGATCEYQLRACRAGYKAQPIDVDPYFDHTRKSRAYGSAITETLTREPEKRRLFIKTPPEISVIITAYNFGDYLPRAVQSILGQTFQSTEIIIVDDGSTDKTGRVGQSLADPWKGIHYIRQDNQGASVAANTGIQKAKGRYVTVLDGDDWMAPTRLEKMHALIEANPHSVIYDDVTFVYGEGRTKVRKMPPYDFEEIIHKNGMHKGILYSRRAWLEVGGYSPQMDNGREDWEINIKLGLAGYCGVHLEEPLYMYRREGQGRTQIIPRPRSYFKEKITRLHPDLYLKGTRPMACCGGRRRPVTKPASVTITKTTDNLRLTEPPANGWVPVEYIGTSAGNQTIFGPTFTRYKYGRNARNLRFWVHPEDLEFMLNTGLFVRFQIPRTEKPKPTPPPKAPKTPETPETPDNQPQVTMSEEKLRDMAAAEIQATSYAQKLAEETGISLIDVPHDGDKIGISDVREYLDGLGIAY